MADEWSGTTWTVIVVLAGTVSTLAGRLYYQEMKRCERCESKTESLEKEVTANAVALSKAATFADVSAPVIAEIKYVLPALEAIADEWYRRQEAADRRRPRRQIPK
jgi:hypothetical protein